MVATTNKRIAENSPLDGKSKASRKSKLARRKTIAMARGSEGEFNNSVDMTVLSENNQTIEAANTMLGNLTMNKTLIGKLSQKMEKRSF